MFPVYFCLQLYFHHFFLHFYVVIIEQSPLSHLNDLIATQTVYNKQKVTFQNQLRKMKIIRHKTAFCLLFLYNIFVLSVFRSFTN